MPHNEVFPYPTIKQVIFQIRFPNLFYIENKIGDLQVEIMDLFPESSLAFQQPFLIADLGSNVQIEEINEKLKSEKMKKIWNFTSPKNYSLHIQGDSLDITSEYHKTYNNETSENKFRDVIAFVLEKFFGVMKLPLITRIGLRYIDECPLPTKNTPTYLRYFESAFNMSKFPLEQAMGMEFKTVISKGPYFLRYVESLQKKEESYKVILDFDAFSNIVKPGDCLEVTDALHAIISEEYFRTIKDPVIELMRRGQ
jgi:uncharacterized protein (TIGR04255 family)